MSLLSVLGTIGGIVGAPFTGGASLIPSLVGLGTSAADTIINHKGINAAAQAQLNALNNSAGIVKGIPGQVADTMRRGQQDAWDTGVGRMYESIQANQPYVDAGMAGLYGLGDMADVQPGSPVQFQFDPTKDVMHDPGFQYRIDEAMKALSRSAAGRGALRSGGTMLDLIDKGQKMASQEYGAAYDRGLNLAKTRYSTAADQESQQFNERLQARAQQQGRYRTLAEFGNEGTARDQSAMERFASQVMGLDMDTARAIAQAQSQSGYRLGDIAEDVGNVQAGRAIGQSRNTTSGINSIGSNLISLASALRRNGGYDDAGWRGSQRANA